MRILKQWLNTLLAHYCELCGQATIHNLCPFCVADLPYFGDKQINLSSINSSVPSGTTKQTELSTYFDYIYCEFSYDWPIDEMIIQLKFGKNLVMAQILGERLAEGLIHHQLPLPDCIVPMPLHNKRLKQRGFNQANEIAKAVSNKLSIPIQYTLIHRQRYTRAQTELSQDERLNNLHNAFITNHPDRYQHIAIIDDVITTGSTLLELTQLLKKQGVKTISIWVCAHSQLL